MSMKTHHTPRPIRSLALASAAATTLFLIACSGASSAGPSPIVEQTRNLAATSGPQAPFIPATDKGEAIFAGGCFWCTESDFEKKPGVIEAISGYTSGTLDDPTYKQVTRTETGHYEAVKVIYDPDKVSYRELVDFYWGTVDPTDPTGQFCDKGSSYRTAIFPTPEQAQDAKASKDALIGSGVLDDPVVTPIIAATTFYPAEDYHQDYYKKNPVRYNFYRNGCGRDARLEQLWGK